MIFGYALGATAFYAWLAKSSMTVGVPTFLTVQSCDEEPVRIAA